MIRRSRGTTAVITGATSGIGRQTAIEFARAGANVVIAGRREERLHQLVSEIGWGAVYASKAAVARTLEQRGGGVIINVSSIFGKRGVPFQTAYCASKFALAGFSEALRAEVMSNGIDVSTIFPGAVETEIFESAANQTGMEAPSFVPKFSAKAMARIIVQTARFPRPEVVMSLDAQAIDFFNNLAPGLMDLALGWSVPFIEGMRRGAPPATPKSGNLYQPSHKE